MLGVVLFAVFVYWEARHAALPIVPIHLFRIKTVIGVYISTMMSGMTFFVVMYYIPQFIQLVRGSSAVTSSVLVLPFLAPVGSSRSPSICHVLPADPFPSYIRRARRPIC
jgi:hypothetical protein